jgi:hypothetical protein
VALLVYYTWLRRVRRAADVSNMDVIQHSQATRKVVIEVERAKVGAEKSPMDGAWYVTATAFEGGYNVTNWLWKAPDYKTARKVASLTKRKVGD